MTYSFHYFMSIGWTVLYLSLGKTFPAFTRPKIRRFGLSHSTMDFKYFYVHIFPRPLVRRIYLKFLPRPLIRWIYLRFIFLCLILVSGKAYRRYIPTSRNFTCLGLLAFLWTSLNENNIRIRNSHIIYIGNPNCIYTT